MPATRIIVGFDTEYQQADPAGLGRPSPLVFKGPPKRPGHKSKDWRARQAFNDVLAYSVCVLDPATGEQWSAAVGASKQSADGLHEFADWRKRLTLFGLVKAAIAGAVANGAIPANPADGYQVILAAHFTAADFPAFRDFEDLTQHKKRFFAAIRKTYVTLDRPLKRTGRIPGIGHKVPISVRLVDTILWSPATHKSIAALGDAIGLPKIVLPKGAIENMSGLAASDPALFEQYAIRDAEVAALYAHQFLSSCRNTFGVNRVPVTASSVGVSYFAATMARNGLTTDDLVGRDVNGETTPHASDVIHIAAECFHGGRNETFWVGPTPEGLPLYDLDLGGCYPSCMAHIRMPDYERREITTNIGRLAVINEGFAFARVRFEFPSDVRFPVLPVRGDGGAGLFFPRSGVSWCTGPELVCALNLGAEITVEHGLFVPWASDFKPFLAALSSLQEIRSSEKAAGRKGSVDERLAKEIANSIYGQTARAVSGMRQAGDTSRGFDLYDGSRPDLPAGKISSAPCAAYITGFARAAVGELINATPRDATVISATTDGYLASIPLEEVDRSGPLFQAFEAGRHAIDPNEPALEEKHRAGRVLSLRTRGALSIEGDRSRDPLLARAGNRMDEGDLVRLAEQDLGNTERAWAENDYWLDWAAKREYGDKVKRSRLTSIAEQWALRGGDLTRKTMDVSVAMEFDHKRKIMDPVTEWRGVFGAPTTYWETVQEARDTRARFKEWRHDQERVLKTADDLEDFQRFSQGLKPKGTKGRGAKTSTAVDAIRWASAHGMYGLPDIVSGRSDLAAGKWNMTTIAEALTRAGVPTSKQAIRRMRMMETRQVEDAPDPETLSKLKVVIAAMEDEMRQKQVTALGLVDKVTGPNDPDKPAEITVQKQQGNGTIHKRPEYIYIGKGIPVTLKEVRDIAAVLSISRLKTDRAIAAYRKRLNGDAPQDPVTLAINALAAEAFGPDAADGPDMIRELIDTERKLR